MDIISWFSFFFVEDLSCLYKFVIKTEPKDFTHLFELTFGLRQLVYLPEAIYVIYVRAVVERNANI